MALLALRETIMFSNEIYPQVLLAIAGGLLTLLGSVGIFISLIIQRRLDRLQDTLEEFINLSYRSETNLSGLMYNLIEKYQMHYMFPRQPRLMILRYIDLNVFFIIILWVIILFTYYEPPLQLVSLFRLIPLVVGIYAALFFRKLLRNTINLENPLLDSIVPVPTRLRSISYLSHFINLSVKSILKQARLTLFLTIEKKEGPGKKVSVFLKEELSFDDFFYYFLVSEAETEKPVFISYGEIRYYFPPDPITGKPVPIRRNLNIPLGSYLQQQEDPPPLQALFLVFTRGEKHPIQYLYQLDQETSFYNTRSIAESTVNHQIVYTIHNNRVSILSCEAKIPYFSELGTYFRLDGQRYFLDTVSEKLIATCQLQQCTDQVFID